jgi:hypothetical protein
MRYEKIQNATKYTIILVNVSPMFPQCENRWGNKIKKERKHENN